MGTYQTNTNYDQTYFSGSQVGIFIGDLWVDDIYGLEFQVQAGMRPIYGYRSPNFDLLLRENEIVVGSFAMNFKESGFLWLILDRYTNKKTSLLDRIKNVQNKDKDLAVFDRTTNSVISPNSARQTIDSAMLDRAFESATTVESKTNVLEKTNELNFESFEYMSANFENAVWGKQKQSYGTFGSMNFKDAQDFDVKNPKVRGLQNSSFNITITYGNVFEDKSSPLTTTELLQDVVLTNVSKTLDLSGNPVQERYSFIARRAF